MLSAVPYLDRNGTRIFYDTAGDGPAVLLSHGYSATSAMWHGQREALSKDHKLIVWDMRGHGRSDSPGDPAAYSEELTVQDMAAILDACGAETAAIGGLSLGGYMSLAFHLASSDRTKALLLFDTGPGYKSDEARRGWNDMANKTADQLDKKGFAALGQGAEVRAAAHRSAEGLARAARGLLAQRDASVIESLPKVEVPTLVLAGAEDKPFLAATDYMATRIPNATKVLIPAAGHAANIDQPEAFNDAVTGFLTQIGW